MSTESKEPTIEEMVGNYHARVAKESGLVTDKRRLVAFLYLLMRDHAPCGMVGNVLLELDGVAPYDSEKPIEWAQWVRDRSARLCDTPTERLRDFLARSLALAPEGVWLDIERNLPLADDIETTFTNGWLAQYARWIATELTRA